MGAPLEFFPVAGADAPTLLPVTDPNPLVQQIPPNELRRTKETVDYLRKVLKQEEVLRAKKTTNPTEAQASASFYLREFREALVAADESSLNNNPFYELTRLVFRHNLSGVKSGLKNSQSELLAQTPEPVSFFRGYQEIWFSQPSTFFARMLETLGKGLMSGKVILVLIFTLLSILTTTVAVYDFLQSDPSVVAMGWSHGGGRGDMLTPLLLGFLVALLLVLPVLTFKYYIYRGMAESGRILAGICHAFAQWPRRMIFVLFLTIASIKSNYDGIIVVFFKTADLTQQVAQIQTRIRIVLGEKSSAEGEGSSLQDQRVQLGSWGTEVASAFQKMVENGQGRKDPHDKSPRNSSYWAKYFIVHGGYLPGMHDVVHRFGNRSSARRQDLFLSQSGFNLTDAIEQKSQRILTEYENHALRTHAFIRGALKKIGPLFTLQANPSPAEETAESPWTYLFSRMHPKNLLLSVSFRWQVQQGNQALRAVISALQANEKIYIQTVTDLSALITQTNALLTHVDPHVFSEREAGTTLEQQQALRTLTTLRPPPFRLQQLDTPLVLPDTVTFTQLKENLVQAFGQRSAVFLLGCILLLSAALDLVELLLFSAMTAWRGRKDRAQMDDRFQALQRWEAMFALEGKLFFGRTDVQQVFPSMTFPSESALRNALHLILETNNPKAKDRVDQTPAEKWHVWYTSLVRPVRMADMVAYNARAAAVHRFKKQPDNTLSQWVEYLFPGIKLNRGIGSKSFADLYQEVEAAIAASQKAFQTDLQEALMCGYDVTLNSQEKILAEHERFTPKGLAKGRAASVKARGIWSDFGLRHCFRFTKHWGHAPFYSRRTWLKEVAEDNENFKMGVRALHDFMPTLKNILSETLPEIQKDILDPLMDILDRLPTRSSRASFMGVDSLWVKFKKLEKLTLEVLDISQLMGPETDEKLLSTLTDKEEVNQMSRIIQGGKNKKAFFFKKIQHLTDDLRKTLQQAQAMEFELDKEIKKHMEAVRKAREEVQQMLLQINVRAREARKKRPPPQKHLKILLDNQTLFEQAPLQADALLGQAEALLDAPLSEKKLATLTEWSLKIQLIAANVRGILQTLETPTHVDRRLDAAGRKEEKPNERVEKKGRQILSPRQDQKGASKTASGKSRRKAERESYATGIEFISQQGHCYRGTSVDISSTGLRFVPIVNPTRLAKGEEGNLRLLSNLDRKLFPCKVVSTSPSFIALQLQDDIQIFETLVAQQVLEELEMKRG